MHLPINTPYPTITKFRVGATADKMAPVAPAMAAAMRITQAPQ